MRCGRSVPDPPDDPVAFEAVGEVAKRLIERLDGAESVRREQLLLDAAVHRAIETQTGVLGNRAAYRQVPVRSSWTDVNEVDDGTTHFFPQVLYNAHYVH